MKFLAFFVLLSSLAFCQEPLTGVVYDAATKQPIPYAVAGIPSKKLGTVCDDKGNFKLAGPLSDSDTLKISAIGYYYRLISAKELAQSPLQVYLKPQPVQLAEVNVKAGKLVKEIAGNKKFNKKNCTAFIGKEDNWKGEEAAIRANYDAGQRAQIEDFNFYIVQNKYEDTLVFRLMLYNVGYMGLPGRTFLTKPVIFKTAVKQGPVHIDLKDYMIFTEKDFFISLECLMDKMEAGKFCFAGSIDTPSYVRKSAFSNWTRVSRGGADFNVTLSYQE